MAHSMARLRFLPMASPVISSQLHSLYLQFRVSRHYSAGTFLLTGALVYDRLGIAWATSLLGFLSVVLLPVPWILFKWGPQIRQKSAYKITEH